MKGYGFPGVFGTGLKGDAESKGASFCYWFLVTRFNTKISSEFKVWSSKQTIFLIRGVPEEPESLTSNEQPATSNEQRVTSRR